MPQSNTDPKNEIKYCIELHEPCWIGNEDYGGNGRRICAESEEAVKKLFNESRGLYSEVDCYARSGTMGGEPYKVYSIIKNNEFECCGTLGFFTCSHKK